MLKRCGQLQVPTSGEQGAQPAQFREALLKGYGWEPEAGLHPYLALHQLLQRAAVHELCGSTARGWRRVALSRVCVSQRS